LVSALAVPSMQNKLPDNNFDTYVERTRLVTLEQINGLAKRIIHPNNLVWVVVGDMKTIEADIRELNLGEIHKIDVDGNPVN